MTGYDAAMQIFGTGYARRRLRPHERAALKCLRSIAGRFFAGDPEWEHLFCGGATGYQPYGTRWADPDTDDPARRDGCERLDDWAGHGIPGIGQMPMLQVALNWWQYTAARIADQTLGGIAARYAYQRTWDFRPTSWLEASWYPNFGDGIAPHMDGHLITVLAVDGPGLEADTGAGMAPLWGGPDELVIFPGELMAAMTAGDHAAERSGRRGPPARSAVGHVLRQSAIQGTGPTSCRRACRYRRAGPDPVYDVWPASPCRPAPLTGPRESACGPGRRTVRPAGASSPATASTRRPCNRSWT